MTKTLRSWLQTHHRMLLATIGATFVVAIVWISLRGYMFVRSLDALVGHSAFPEFVRVDWSTGPPAAPNNLDYVHVHIPDRCALFSNPSDRWLVAPFCHVDEVEMTNTGGQVLYALKKFSSLRSLTLRRLRNTTDVQWKPILRFPLEQLMVVDCGLPGDALTQIAQRGTIKELLLAREGPFNADEAVSLGRCHRLEMLSLSNVSGLPDDVLSQEIRRLQRLKRVDLAGKEIGERTILALPTLPVLEEVWILDSDLRPEVFESLSACRRLHTVCIARSRVDDAVLAALMSIASLKNCFLQEGSMTPNKIQEFREKRPDVALKIPTRLRLLDAPDE